MVGTGADCARTGAATVISGGIQTYNAAAHEYWQLKGVLIDLVLITDGGTPAPRHRGHGGWTWYTGAAACFDRLGIEQVLIMRRKGDQLIITPCLPPS
ncbi:MAG: hypothetical protein HXY39_03235 [Chloroflexi bacterium]|nr:hypothetical protein [Chloroflexota bacterium]